ncbi:TonB-dependent receptor [Nonlabens tegetincola]|uniref:TonB-dependent receptor n=1 Tax=Nonlabens tegetincola TaxID=323273 RepID=UPI000CF42AA1|nr:carboxypeptidase regulatory-like domain-containing protein [Nonlabens tegetincola]PQJ19009.1 TonB-dependent receptor [Nonlabens tegetincola]
MKKQLQFLATLAMFFVALVATAQVTTSSINGRVLEAGDEPLLGATIVAVHGPTGTNYGSATDINGYYRITNMRVGGPYTITFSYVGKKDEVFENIFLQLGESETFNVTLSDEANALDEVVIKATRDGIFDSNNTGPETNISTREINTLPTVTRGIDDILRKTPQAQVTEGGSISIAGQNNRYNSIFIDGAVNNDVFGLAGTGTNGGQIGINPISLDAIESFQVNIAPFDVRQSGFTGGAINAITRSGTNNWEGSAYWFNRNEKLAGKTPQAVIDEIDDRNGSDPAPDRERLDEFSTNLYGFRVGGPIIKNKLFMFVNAEIEREETPRPFDFNQYVGDARNAAGDTNLPADPTRINNLRDNLINLFGYNPGSYENTNRTLDTDRFTIRLDYNVNDKNTLVLKHNYVRGESTSPSTSSATSINFANAGVFFPSETNFTTLEWNSQINNKLSNNLIASYTTVRDDRDPIGGAFPRVSINDGAGSITFGSEAFSTGNILDQDVFTITNNFQIAAGAHNITLGGNFESYDIRNVFIRQNFGQYRFNSLADFESYFDNDPSNDVAPTDYDYSYSLLDPAGTTGDDATAAAAQFNYSQLGLYAQDEWKLTKDFKLSYGVRVDVPFFEEGTANDDFNTRTVALLEAAGKDLQGARVGKKIKSQIHVSPRLGFNWDAFGDKTTQVRGGLGIFTSRIPLVWPGGAYNNNGISVGGVNENDFDSGTLFFEADPFNQPIGNGPAPGSGTIGGQIDLFAPDFKLPQVAKYSLGVDQKLGVWGLIASADFLYNETINNVLYQNLNIGEPVGSLNGADTRPLWNDSQRIDSEYSRIILGTNTNEGWSYNASFVLTKPFDNGFSGQIAYTYGQGKSIFEGTSSQNSSQWRNVVTVNGKNRATIGNSQFALGHRITANASYQMEWSENFATTVSLFYNGQQGGTLSYIYDEGADLLNDDSSDNALFYIPRNQSEINLVDANGVSAADQWAALDAFIEGNDYLRERRGQYAERNGDRGPWNHIVDLKVLQDFKLDFGGKKHTFQASLDIFNFFNFLNKDWGVQKRITGSFGEVEIVETERGGPDPEFSFDPDFAEGFEQIDDAGIRSSRWQAQIGLRYIFN